MLVSIASVLSTAMLLQSTSQQSSSPTSDRDPVDALADFVSVHIAV